MEKRKMLVTEGLNRLKVLNSRIYNQISNADFIIASKISDKNAKPGITKEDFIKDANASYQSINDLINEYEYILIERPKWIEKLNDNIIRLFLKTLKYLN